jgi:hypothetical protein
VRALSPPLTPSWCCIAYFPKPSHREERARERSFLTVSPAPAGAFSLPYRRGIDDPAGAATRPPTLAQRRPTLHAHVERGQSQNRSQSQSQSRGRNQSLAGHRGQAHGRPEWGSGGAQSRSDPSISFVHAASTSMTRREREREREHQHAGASTSTAHPNASATVPAQARQGSRPRPLPRIPSAPHMRRTTSEREGGSGQGQGGHEPAGSHFRATPGGAYLYVDRERELEKREREREKEREGRGVRSDDGHAPARRVVDMDDHARRAAAALENVEDPEAARRIGYDEDWRQAGWMRGLHPYAAAAGSWSSLARVASEEGC